jgi:ABC-type nitrate/sulfonate/bicarbonate transport system substrate-binding protein
VAAAGCGGDSSSSGGTTGSADLPTLTLAMATPTDLEPYVAVANGYFDKAGVKVSITENTGAQTSAALTGGKADLAFFSTAGPLLVAAGGKPTTVIWGVNGGGQGGNLIASKKFPDMASLRGAKSCTIGAFPAGSQGYGYAALYKERLSLKCRIAPYSDAASQLGALLSNRADALVGAISNFTSATNQGKAAVLVDTRQAATRQQLIGTMWPDSVIYGLSSTVSKKRKAIEAYIKGVDEARKFIQANSPETLTKLVKSHFAGFKTLSDEQALQNIAAIKPYVGLGGDGFVSKEVWDEGLKQMAFWGLPNYAADRPDFGYGARVDMSYYRNALGKG